MAASATGRDVLSAVLARGMEDVLLAGITDPPAVEACFVAGRGTSVRLRIGGALDPSSRPVDVDAEILILDDPGGQTMRQAVVRVCGVTVVLAARRRPYHDISDLHPPWP